MIRYDTIRNHTINGARTKTPGKDMLRLTYGVKVQARIKNELPMS